MATVDQEGKVTAIAPGTTTITVMTVEIGSFGFIPKTASCTVDVESPESGYDIIASNLDEYHTVKGVNPDASAYDYHDGFILDKFFASLPQIQTYTKPDVNSNVVENKGILSYFHVTSKVRNNGVLWYQLDDGTYVQTAKLSDESWFTTANEVQPGAYRANEDTFWTRAPFDTPDTGLLAEGTEVKVITAVYVPFTRKTWYRATYNNTEMWLDPAAFSLITPAPSIRISGIKYPAGERKEGLSFELKGKIDCSENIISIEGAVYDLDTNSLAEFSTQVNPAIITPNKRSVEIYPTAINTSLKFGDLSAGDYRYELKAKTESGYETVLVSSVFTIIGEDDPGLGDLIERIPVTSLAVSTGSIELEQNDSYRVVAFTAPDNATEQDVLWTSSDPSVATVNSNGMVRAVGVGTATITAATTDGSGLSKQITVTAIAAQASADGLEYTINDGKVSITGGTVSGTVRIPETIEGYPVVSVRGLAGKGITSVYIPKTVTDMWGAFYQDKTLTYACFEDGATIIPSQAFQATSNLKYVYIPDSVTEIAYYAFSGCDLSSVQLPSNLKKIGFSAFAGNSRLSEIELPSGLELMEDSVFAGTSITSVMIPSSVNSMVLTFSGCN